MSLRQIQSKIICGEFILLSLITASPHGFIWERHWSREAAEETHLPPLPALPQECFSSGPLSPMCRRPLGRVCFACKAGCRCCPQKQPGGTRGDGDTRRPHCRATRLASPRFAATPSAAPLPLHLSLLHPSTGYPPSSSYTLHPPNPFPFPVRHATPPSPHPLHLPPRPSLCHPPRAHSCVSPGKRALVGVWRHAEPRQTHKHTPYHFSGQKGWRDGIGEREEEGSEGGGRRE